MSRSVCAQTMVDALWKLPFQQKQERVDMNCRARAAEIER